MRVDHRRLHVRVAEKFLHRADVVPGFQQVCGKRVAEAMAGSVFGEAGGAHGVFDGLL